MASSFVSKDKNIMGSIAFFISFASYQFKEAIIFGMLNRNRCYFANIISDGHTSWELMGINVKNVNR